MRLVFDFAYFRAKPIFCLSAAAALAALSVPDVGIAAWIVL
jgi:hypothetical protein